MSKEHENYDPDDIEDLTCDACGLTFSVTVNGDDSEVCFCPRCGNELLK